MKHLYAALWALCLVFGLYSAITRAWTCDDAFISFRYAQNLVEGRGLVFNAGEYVEGYTNFLWTLLTAAAMRGGIDPVVFGETAGVISFGLLLLVLAIRPRLDRSSFRREGSGVPWRPVSLENLPLAPAFCAVLLHLQIFATSGLETMFFTLLGTSGFLLTSVRGTGGETETAGPADSRWAMVGGFFLLSCAVLTRPDGVLFYAAAALIQAVRSFQRYFRGDRLTHLRSLSASLLIPHIVPALLLTTFGVWKLWYYGDILPNTFYAKSAHRAYPGQGLKYIGLFFASYWMLIVPFALLLARFLRRRRAPDEPVAGGRLANPMDTEPRWADRPGRDPRSYSIALLSAIWIVYVTWVGGDFMFGRFLIPIVPILVVAIENVVLEFAGSGSPRSPFRFLVLVLWLAAVSLRFDPFKGEQIPVVAGISEESRIYTPPRVSRARSLGEELAPVVSSSGVRLGFVGAQAALIYYMAPGFAVEAETGLTDKLIARQPLESRGRIGHEKAARLEYLQSRGIHILLRPTMDTGTGTVEIEGLAGPFPILTYDAKVFSELAKSPRFRFHRGPP